MNNFVIDQLKFVRLQTVEYVKGICNNQKYEEHNRKLENQKTDLRSDCHWIKVGFVSLQRDRLM